MSTKIESVQDIQRRTGLSFEQALAHQEMLRKRNRLKNRLLTTPQIEALIGAAEAMLAGEMDGTGDDVGIKRDVLERASEALKEALRR